MALTTPLIGGQNELHFSALQITCYWRFLMAYVKWSFETLEKFCGDVFEAFGFDAAQSARISDVLLPADLYGIESHGMQRMVRYHKGL